MPIQVLPEIRISNAGKIFIGGQWVQPTTDRRLHIVSPNTEELVFETAQAVEADVDRAVAAARNAFDSGPWPRLNPAQRAEKLLALAQEIEKRLPELGRAWTEQMGILYSQSSVFVHGGVASLNAVAGWAVSYDWEKERKTSDGQGVGLIIQEPIGVVAAICPWNAPFSLMIDKIGPALLAGCTVIMKPAPETPLDAYIIAECSEAAGFPDGVVNLIPADREASDYLVRSPGVDRVTFTGSTAAGRRIAAACAERIARVTLELGGKSAAIVLDDADVETTATSLAQAGLILNGQACALLSRVLVPRSLHDKYADAFCAAMSKIKVGNSYDVHTQLGPLAMKRQLARVEGYIAKGKAAGARVVTGGNRPKDLNRGYFIEPTVFADVDNSSIIAQEEIFGPVLCLIPYDGIENAISIANDSIYGLNGAVYTNDSEQAYRIARRVRTGNVSQSEFKVDHEFPFGGFKQSGLGREFSIEALSTYLDTKVVHLREKPKAA